VNDGAKMGSPGGAVNETGVEIRKRTTGKKQQYQLSVVVIGRNEGKRLPGLFSSLPAGNDIEWIYVDSYSTDDSVNTALECGAKVYRVEKDCVYGPGTGRYIGTKEASGCWVLYLDGDMILRQEFAAFIERLKSERNLPPATAGFVGRTCNRYIDQHGSIVSARDYVVLSQREMGPAEDWGRPVFYHGGAVLYLKEYVLMAGNWNPNVYQLEEIDLYSRVRALGGILRAVDLPMADHYTPDLSLGEKIKLNFLPRYRGKNLYGAGQVVAARFRAGSLLSFIRFYPYPFVVLSGLLLAPPLYMLQPGLALLLNLVIAAWIAVTKKSYYYLVYLGNLLQIFRGLGRYRPREPRYRRIAAPDK